jgi:hypothetical protein
MNRLARITALSATIDTTLNEFALAANAQGEYPWQQAQRERRNRRMAGAAVGTAAIGAGAYGAKKGHEAIMKRGLPGLQDAAGGPVRTADAYKSVAKEGVDKLKGAVGGTRVGQYGKNLAGGYQQARKGAMIMGKPTGGKGMIGAGLAALRKVKFSRADQIIALEAKMDEALEFAMKEDEKKSWPKNRVGLPAGSIAAGVAAYGADKAIMNRAKKKYGFTPTRATAYGEGVTDAMKSGKRMMKRGVAQAKYQAEPVVRKIKGALGMRKVAGMLK